MSIDASNCQMKELINRPPEKGNSKANDKKTFLSTAIRIDSQPNTNVPKKQMALCANLKKTNMEVMICAQRFEISIMFSNFA